MGLREGELENQDQEAGVDLESGRPPSKSVGFSDDPVEKSKGVGEEGGEETQDTEPQETTAVRKPSLSVKAAKPKTWRQTQYKLVVNGEIKCGDVKGYSQLYCRYSYYFGPDWVLRKGAQAYGITQIAQKRTTIGGGYMDGVHWGFPIQSSFVSTNVHGWPQICVSVFGQDWLGRDIVVGYGSTHIPLHSGRYARRVRLYTPQTTSFLTKMANLAFGVRPEYVNPSFPCVAAGRELTSVRSEGYVDIEFDIDLTHDDGMDHGEFLVPEKQKFKSWWQRGLSVILPSI